MDLQLPRGIAVIDAGKTNTKIVLFGPDGRPVAERKVASLNHEGPPYRAIDPAPLIELCRTILPELDAILPIDVVVPSAHGAALACLGEDGTLALPVMDYNAEPPPEIIAAYHKVQPPFEEVFCSLLPMALTHGLQLFWQQQAFPRDFARVKTVVTVDSIRGVFTERKTGHRNFQHGLPDPSPEYPRWRLFIAGEAHGMGTAVSAHGQGLGDRGNPARRIFGKRVSRARRGAGGSS